MKSQIIRAVVVCIAAAMCVVSCGKSTDPVQVTFSAPSDLQVQAQSPTSAVLTWKDNSNDETGFAVERRSENDDVWQTLEPPVAVDQTEFHDTGLEPVTTYVYRIRGCNLSGACGTSGESSVTTPGDIVAPSNVRATASSVSEVTITWQNNSDNVTSLTVNRRQAGGTDMSLVASLPPDRTSCPDPSVVCGESYEYVVEVCQGSNFCVTSDAASVTVPIPAPTDVTAEFEPYQGVRITWDYPDDVEAEFDVYREYRVLANQDSHPVKIASMTVGAREHIDSTAGALLGYYTYTILARKGTVVSGVSDAVATSAPPRPSAPTDLTAGMIFDNSFPPSRIVRLDWGTVPQGTVRIQIYRAEYRLVGQQLLRYSLYATHEGTNPPFEDSDVRTGYGYCYKIKFDNGNWLSGYSNSACAP